MARALSSAERNYTQIEKELLASTYGCERFHQYVYGQAFDVETDHKPLLSIMSKPLNDCPMRIQRMLIRLQRYDFEMIYTPGKYMFAADVLSHALDQTESGRQDKCRHPGLCQHDHHLPAHQTSNTVGHHIGKAQAHHIVRLASTEK